MDILTLIMAKKHAESSKEFARKAEDAAEQSKEYAEEAKKKAESMASATVDETKNYLGIN